MVQFYKILGNKLNIQSISLLPGLLLVKTQATFKSHFTYMLPLPGVESIQRQAVGFQIV